MAVNEWIPDLARRLAQLNDVAGLDNMTNVEVWLGGLFFPEAYITATRQAVAHRKRWSLETLSMRLDIEKVNDPSGFIVDGKLRVVFVFLIHLSMLFIIGLALEGAAWSTDKLVLND